MLQRILVAVVGIPALLFILILAPDWATAALLCALCAVGAHELLAATVSPEKTRRWWGLSGITGITVICHTYLQGIGQTAAANLTVWLLAAFLVLHTQGTAVPGHLRCSHGRRGHSTGLQLPDAAAADGARWRHCADRICGGLLL